MLFYCDVEVSDFFQIFTRIGVGDSVRYLKRQGKKAAQLMASKEFLPDKLQRELAPTISDPALKVAGQHVFCFNLVERTETWRHDFIASLENSQKH